MLHRCHRHGPGHTRPLPRRLRPLVYIGGAAATASISCLLLAYATLREVNKQV